MLFSILLLRHAYAYMPSCSTMLFTLKMPPSADVIRRHVTAMRYTLMLMRGRRCLSASPSCRFTLFLAPLSLLRCLILRDDAAAAASQHFAIPAPFATLLSPSHYWLSDTDISLPPAWAAFAAADIIDIFSLAFLRYADIAFVYQVTVFMPLNMTPLLR